MLWFRPHLLAASFGALSLYALGAAAWWPATPHWPLRLTLIGMTAWFIVKLLQHKKLSLLLSPLTALGLISLVFYSLIPYLHMSFGEEYVALKDAIIAQAQRFRAGRGELLVFHFSALCLAISSLLMKKAPAPDGVAGEPSGTGVRWIGMAAVLVVFSAGILLLALRTYREVAAILPDELARQLVDGMPSLIVFAAITLSYLAARPGRGWRWAAVICVLFGAAVLMSGYTAKQPVFMISACILTFISIRHFSTRSIALAAVTATLVLVSGLLILSYLRGSFKSPEFRSVWASHLVLALIGKVSERQLETGACLQRAIEKHIEDPKGASPFYFGAILIPRALWKKKPSFSEGMEFGIEFCAIPRAKTLLWETPQSFSITLLGQPVVRAGWLGLIVAEATLITGLWLISLFGLGRGMPGLIGMAALLPWLADFDQSFALYIGNAVKMFLFQSILLLGLLGALKGRRRKPVLPAANADR